MENAQEVFIPSVEAWDAYKKHSSFIVVQKKHFGTFTTGSSVL